MRPIIASLSLVLLLLAGCQMEREPIADIAAEAPDNVTVLLSNPYVRAAEYRLAPGEGLPLHMGGPRLVYSLSDYRVLWEEQGREVEQEWSKGQVHWHDSLPHAIRNIGTTEAHYLVVTRLTDPLPPEEEAEHDDVADVDPKKAKVIFSNEMMRLLQVTLAAGEGIPMHEGHPRVIYSLTDYTLEFAEEGKEPETTAHTAGEAHFHGPVRHAVKNVGTTDARFLVFGLKK